MSETLTSEDRGALGALGFLEIRGPFAEPDDAWNAARTVIDAAAATEAPLAVIGDFVIPPPDGPPSRDFQTLHFDFGLPLAPRVPTDIARFTALHVRADALTSAAATRLVPLPALLAGARWPNRDELIQRFAAYGDTHGTWDDTSGYTEGSLARIVEAALGERPALPSVKEHPDFLCGTEFASLADELHFFTRRGLSPDAVGIDVRLSPGDLLVFDNLANAHGRSGTRAPGELHQRLFGHKDAPVRRQLELRDRTLAAFGT